MVFQYPLALIGLVLIPLIIILRIWQARPIKIYVSSILVWRQLSETAPQAKQRAIIKIVLVTLLLILAVSALVLGLARPVLKTTTLVVRPIIILLDNSSTMNSLTNDKTTTRWQQAVRELKTLLTAVPLVTSVSLLVGAQGVGNTYLDKSPEEVSDLIDQLTPVDLASDTEELIRRAVGLINRYRNGQAVPYICICSDRMPVAETLKLLTVEPCFILVGEPSRNYGLTHIAANQKQGTTLIDMLVRINNFSDSVVTGLPLEISGQIFDESGKIAATSLITRTTVSLKAREEKTLILENLASAESSKIPPVIEASLRVTDDLAVDNRVWLSLMPQHKARVAVIGSSAPSLLRILQLQPQLAVEYLPVSNLKVSLLDFQAYDLYIFNHCLPAPAEIARPIVLINPPDDFYPFKVAGTITNPVPNSLDLNAPLLAYVNLSEVHFWMGLKIEVAPENKEVFHNIVSADGHPLIGEWRTGNQPGLLIGFDPEWRGATSQTDWTMSISFPIFWTNLVNYLLVAAPLAQDYIFYHTGTVIKPNLRTLFSAEQLAGSKEIILVRPDGTRKSFTAISLAFIPDKVGIYQIKAGEQTRFFSVNLCVADGSDNSGQLERSDLPAHYSWPYPDKSGLPHYNGIIKKDQTSKIKDQIENTTTQLRSLTAWFALVGLGFLLLAWYLERRV